MGAPPGQNRAWPLDVIEREQCHTPSHLPSASGCLFILLLNSWKLRSLVAKWCRQRRKKLCYDIHNWPNSCGFCVLGTWFFSSLTKNKHGLFFYYRRSEEALVRHQKMRCSCLYQVVFGRWENQKTGIQVAGGGSLSVKSDAFCKLLSRRGRIGEMSRLFWKETC